MLQAAQFGQRGGEESKKRGGNILVRYHIILVSKSLIGAGGNGKKKKGKYRRFSPCRHSTWLARATIIKTSRTAGKEKKRKGIMDKYLYPIIRSFGHSAFRLPCSCSSASAPELDTLFLVQALNLSLFFLLLLSSLLTLPLRITLLQF